MNCAAAVDDLDIEHQVAHVLGRGGRNRDFPFGAKTADALYIRFRARHSLAGLPNLWLGKKGRLSDSGLCQMRRCIDAGIPPVHPHQFRHTFAHDWLASNGTRT